MVQRTSPPVVHCITFGHFFGSHRSCLRRSLHGITVELFSDKKCDDAVSHTTFEMRGERKKTRNKDTEAWMKKRNNYSKVSIHGKSGSAGVRCLPENGEEHRGEDY